MKTPVGPVPVPNHGELAEEPERAEEYLSVADLSRRIPYAPQTIRNLMSRGVFRLGVHYVKPRGRVIFKWSAIRAWLHGQA
jgi:hypothetical protein